MTVSRAGVLFTLAALFMCGGLFARGWLSSHPRYPFIVGMAIFASILVLEGWGGGIAYRIGLEGLFDLGRKEVYRSTLAMIADNPILGTGIGTFAEAFPAYRGNLVTTEKVWDLAHSVPLEFAAELGLPLTAIAAFVWIFVGWSLLRGVSRRKRDAVLPLGAFGVGVLGTAHSMVDFPLQIPGYAILWAALVGAGLAQSVGAETRNTSQ
jgi:O-antigen ligase